MSFKTPMVACLKIVMVSFVGLNNRTGTREFLVSTATRAIKIPVFPIVHTAGSITQ